MYIIPEFNNQLANPSNLKIETYNGRIKTLKDALLILEGARLGYLPKIKRRLNGLEREFIKPNTIFAWNETECGMKRWTDGKNWSASKVSGPFLIYRELDSDKVTTKPNGLIKQSFSLTTKQNEKLHIIGYYSADDNDNDDNNDVMCPTKDRLLKDLKLNGNIYQEYLLYYDQYSGYNDHTVLVYPNYPMYLPQYGASQGQMQPSHYPSQVSHLQTGMGPQAMAPQPIQHGMPQPPHGAMSSGPMASAPMMVPSVQAMPQTVPQTMPIPQNNPRSAPSSIAIPRAAIESNSPLPSRNNSLGSAGSTTSPAHVYQPVNMMRSQTQSQSQTQTQTLPQLPTQAPSMQPVSPASYFPQYMYPGYYYAPEMPMDRLNVSRERLVNYKDISDYSRGSSSGEDTSPIIQNNDSEMLKILNKEY